jgi:hypothetical protein
VQLEDGRIDLVGEARNARGMGGIPRQATPGEMLGREVEIEDLLAPSGDRQQSGVVCRCGDELHSER